jgi:hypothetical protein
MTTPRLVPALLLCALLASCDSSSSDQAANEAPSDASLVGVWAIDSANERTVQAFTVDRIHESEYLNKCLIQETWGRYTYANGTLRVVFDSLHSRMYFTVDNDSASTCARPMEPQFVQGSMTLRLENVTATNFTAVTKSFVSVNGNTTVSERRRVFTRQ